MKINPLLSLIIAATLFLLSCKNEKLIIYDEADVPNYTLPEVLETLSGKTISYQKDWQLHRKELLDVFSKERYGHIPTKEYTISFNENVLSDAYLDSTAVIKEITAHVSTDLGKEEFTILYVHPKSSINVPVFVGLNFSGNHTLDTLTKISIHQRWVRNSDKAPITDNFASPTSRGTSASRLPLNMIIKRGYGFATAYYGEFDPDYDDGFENGFHPLFASTENDAKTECPSAISMWAKGMSFIADFLVQDTVADPSRIIAIGHSRLGKTALWAGANDQRFAAVISNNSGCGGAALSRRAYGETVEKINSRFPHWFCERFHRYNGKESKLPVDQHMLLALMAPRPLYVASATKDRWADPMGEFLALQAATPVYNLFGFDQDFPDQFPEADKSYRGITGYHLRSGPHDITEYDWLMYMKWAKKWLPE